MTTIMMMMKTTMTKMMGMKIVRRRSVTSLLALVLKEFRRNVREPEGPLTPSIRDTRTGHVDLFLSSSLEGEMSCRH